MRDLKSLNLNEIKKELALINEKPFRAKQIFSWIHQKNVKSLDEMTNLSLDLRNKLKEKFEFNNIELVQRLTSQKDGTRKYLFRLFDDVIIESVLMKYSYGNSVCISSQAGCRMGCTFCASTIGGLERNLTAYEMAAQIYEIEKDCGQRISSVVIMGCGEPFDNYDNFLRFIELINSPDGYNLGQRHITVSTCGIVPKIYELADLKLQITLAISLHAPNNNLRKDIMPVAKSYGFDELLKAAKYYGDTTKRRVTFEYALISGVNDSTEHAKELARSLKGMLSHVNLIPVNSVKENAYKEGTREEINSFADILMAEGIEATVRRTLGSDVDAACGQLRRKYMKNLEVEK